MKIFVPCNGFCVLSLLVVFTLCVSFVRTQTTIITGLTLVDSDSDQDITPLLIETTTTANNSIRIDLAEYNATSLTIRCDVDPTAVSSIGLVEFDLDNGRIVRTEASAPYYLGGNIEGDTDEVNTLQVIGIYTLQITIFGTESGNILEQQVYVISVVDTSSTTGDGGTLSPTVTPLSIYDVANYTADSITGSINGELKKWHKVTIGFSGPFTSETNNRLNPFTDFRLDVTFLHEPSQRTYIVPGFYACNGDAANSGIPSGSIWLVHFRPDIVGNWSYVASFLEGTNVAMYNRSELSAAIASGTVVSASFFDGASGAFVIEKSDKSGRDLRGKGRLKYSPKSHYLRFTETGEYFLKAGADSPENFLAYDEIDNTPNNGGYRKSWSPHVSDYVEGDPTWNNGKGRGIIGAINYLSGTGMNAFSFLTMNINGDDGNVYPYISTTDLDRIDCSKTAQWDVIFDHAEQMGMFLHFKTQETENDQLFESTSGDIFSPTRKLYYRELIARFGHHLALNWNLGEENTNTDQQRKLFSDYIKDIDPYRHPIVVHTYPGEQDEVYQPLLGYKNFDGVSIQIHPNFGYEETLQWVNASASVGRKWIVSYDEQAPATDGVIPDSDDPTHDSVRRNVLWANLMAGGAGVEYYFGYFFAHSDLTAQDFRSRANMWDQSKIALEFFSKFPFWNMTSSNQRVANTNWCLLDPASGDTSIALYLPTGGSLEIDLRDLQISGTFYTIEWYDTMTGGALQSGTVASIQANTVSSIGLAPYNTSQDWAVLLQCADCTQAPSFTPISVEPTLNPEESTTSQPSVIFETSSPTKEIESSPVPIRNSVGPSTIVLGDSIPTRIPTLAPIISSVVLLDSPTTQSNATTNQVYSYALLNCILAFFLIPSTVIF